MLTIYSKSNCPFCDQAKALLTSKNIPFEEIRVDENITAKEFILSQGHRTVPQIYKDGVLFAEGGFAGLRKLNEQQLLQELVC